MKKFLAIAMIAATLTSCGGAETKEEATDTTTVAPTTETPAVQEDTTNKAGGDTTAKADPATDAKAAEAKPAAEKK
jgi:hypothetical protein